MLEPDCSVLFSLNLAASWEEWWNSHWLYLHTWEISQSTDPETFENLGPHCKQITKEFQGFSYLKTHHALRPQIPGGESYCSKPLGKMPLIPLPVPGCQGPSMLDDTKLHLSEGISSYSAVGGLQEVIVDPTSQHKFRSLVIKNGEINPS